MTDGTGRRAGLDAGDILDRALALVEAEGAGALTMRRLATELGVLTSPGTTFGPDGAGWVRIAAVVPDDQLDRVRVRAGLA